MAEIVALEQQRFVGRFRQRIGKAITEIQAGGVTAALPKIAIGIASDSRLSFGNWLLCPFPPRSPVSLFRHRCQVSLPTPKPFDAACNGRRGSFYGRFQQRGVQVCARPRIRDSGVESQFMYTARALVDNFHANATPLVMDKFHISRIDSVGDIEGLKKVLPGARLYLGAWIFERQYAELPPAPGGVDPAGVGRIPFDVEDTLLLLRLFRCGDIGFTHHAIELPDGTVLSQYPYRTFAPISSRHHYQLHETDREAWDAFESELPSYPAWHSPWFQVARRFFLYGSSQAFQPQWDDVDRVLDYCIALEAVFVPEDEFVARRLRERTSRFLDGDESDVDKTKRLINQFYDLRSCTAHGGQLSDKQRVLCNERMTEFEASVRQLFVAAIRQLPHEDGERIRHVKSLYDVGDKERAEKLIVDLSKVKDEDTIRLISEAVRKRLP